VLGGCQQQRVHAVPQTGISAHVRYSSISRCLEHSRPQPAELPRSFFSRGHTIEGWSYRHTTERVHTSYTGPGRTGVLMWSPLDRGVRGAKPKELSGSSSGHKLLKWCCAGGGGLRNDSDGNMPSPPEGGTSVVYICLSLPIPLPGPLTHNESLAGKGLPRRKVTTGDSRTTLHCTSM
jgi:hypothetical protein